MEGVEMLTKNEMKKIGGGVQCMCNGSPAGYCGCQTTQDCLDCCDAVCGAQGN